MSWLDQVEIEMNRARLAVQAGNPGKARTAARRVAGAALIELQKHRPAQKYGVDVTTQRRALISEKTFRKGLDQQRNDCRRGLFRTVILYRKSRWRML
jgi:hypothetical protein